MPHEPQDRVQAFAALALANHHWRDYRNFAGFVSGAAIFVGSVLTRFEADIHPGKRALAYIVRSGIDETVRLLEAYALSAQLDRSIPPELQREGWITPLHAPSRITAAVLSETPTDPFFLAARTLLAGLRAVLFTLAELDPPRALPLMQREFLSILAHPLLDEGQITEQGLRAVASPWIYRDCLPSHPLSMAFEAALEVGARTFAYELFMGTASPLGTT